MRRGGLTLPLPGPLSPLGASFRVRATSPAEGGPSGERLLGPREDVLPDREGVSHLWKMHFSMPRQQSKVT